MWQALFLWNNCNKKIDKKERNMLLLFNKDDIKSTGRDDEK